MEVGLKREISRHPFHSLIPMNRVGVFLCVCVLVSIPFIIFSRIQASAQSNSKHEILLGILLAFGFFSLSLFFFFFIQFAHREQIKMFNIALTTLNNFFFAKIALVMIFMSKMNAFHHCINAYTKSCESIFNN